MVVILLGGQLRQPRQPHKKLARLTQPALGLPLLERVWLVGRIASTCASRFQPCVRIQAQAHRWWQSQKEMAVGPNPTSATPKSRVQMLLLPLQLLLPPLPLLLLLPPVLPLHLLQMDSSLASILRLFWRN